jgi:hypothetical protein
MSLELRVMSWELNAMRYLSSIVLQCGTKDGCSMRLSGRVTNRRKP